MNSFKVLVVDDEREFMQTLVERLSLRNLAAEGVESGPAALERLAAGDMDVVVLDVKMPGMDGVETLKEIKKRHPLVEVVMLTGHADLAASIEGMASGAFDYLLKPVAIDELIQKIQDAYEIKSLKESKIRDLEAVAQAQDKGS